VQENLDDAAGLRNQHENESSAPAHPEDR